MTSGTLVSVTEYLTTTYRPDREYVGGVVLERHLGERDHSVLQAELIIYLYLGSVRRKLGVHVFPEQRVQVSKDRFRVPDITVVAGAKPTEPIFTTPPFLCIEILSKDESLARMKRRVDDYLSFGVPYVWLIDPRERRAWSCTREKTIEVTGALTASSPEIRVPLAEMFSSL